MTIDFEKVNAELRKIADQVIKEKLAEYRSRGIQHIIRESNILGIDGQVIDGLYDLCGGACIHFGDRRSSFFKQYKEYLRNLPENKGSRWLDVHTFSHPRSGRQEYGLNKAVAEACCEYINKNFNAGCWVRPYLT